MPTETTFQEAIKNRKLKKGDYFQLNTQSYGFQVYDGTTRFEGKKHYQWHNFDDVNKLGSTTNGNRKINIDIEV